MKRWKLTVVNPMGGMSQVTSYFKWYLVAIASIVELVTDNVTYIQRIQ
jgi:hypothetical protein